MKNNRSILALIPARLGSKGLKGKNLRLLSGKPLIAYSIEEALKSRYVDNVVVSSEDTLIIETAEKYGANVPFRRPASLAEDHSRGIDVMLHAIEWFKKEGMEYDLILLLQPTSPLRTVKDIDDSIDYLFHKKAKAVVSVCACEHHPLWANTLDETMCMKNFEDESFWNKNRQELPVYYRLTGAIYIAFTDYLIRNNGFMGDLTYAYTMPNTRSVDIDSILDFKLAEIL